MMKRLGFFLALIFIPRLFNPSCLGQVTNTLPDGNKYIGEWKNGQPNGHGTIISPHGAVYVGELKNGKPDGKGVSTLPDGTRYECEFRDGIAGGLGTITTADGKKYIGQLQRGHPQRSRDHPDTGRKKVCRRVHGRQTQRIGKSYGLERNRSTRAVARWQGISGERNLGGARRHKREEPGPARAVRVVGRSSGMMGASTPGTGSPPSMKLARSPTVPGQ